MLAHPYPEQEWVQRFAVELCALRRQVSLNDALTKGSCLWPTYGIFIPEPVARWFVHDEVVVEHHSGTDKGADAVRIGPH